MPAETHTDTTKLDNVQFEASWQGTDISSVQLELQATFQLRTASMLLRGLYSKSEFHLSRGMYWTQGQAG